MIGVLRVTPQQGWFHGTLSRLTKIGTNRTRSMQAQMNGPIPLFVLCRTGFVQILFHIDAVRSTIQGAMLPVEDDIVVEEGAMEV